LLKERVKVSPLGAFFHTEVGPLNRIIHVWPYEDFAQRSQIRTQKIEGWPPKIQEFIEDRPRLAEVGKAARRTWAAHPTWNETAAAIEAYLTISPADPAEAAANPEEGAS